MRGCVDAVRAARHPRQSTLALTVADRQYASHACLGQAASRSQVLRCQGCSGVEKAILATTTS
jgi:hypothetical protein